jgi:hypothetical protein
MNVSLLMGVQIIVVVVVRTRAARLVGEEMVIKTTKGSLPPDFWVR